LPIDTTISGVIALRRSGWLNMTQPMPFSLRAISFSVVLGVLMVAPFRFDAWWGMARNWRKKCWDQL
jgi:hypothetical protein